MNKLSHIYFAAPLFSQAELCFNERTVAAIEVFVPVFLPQRDGGLYTNLLKSGLDRRTAASQVASVDLNAIVNSIGLIAVLDGQSIDDGVAFEIGYAYALGKYCLGFQTDSRRSTLGFCNPMIRNALASVACSQGDLIQSVNSHLQFLRGDA